VATRRFTSLIRINVATICNGWLPVGINPTATQQNGQFELRTNTEAYLRDGRLPRRDESHENLPAGSRELEAQITQSWVVFGTAPKRPVIFAI